uniref:Putative salivary lipocalin n=1 Tax=Ixodes ricinus TaxID=34613 RepID=A0A0K8RL92_IXORI
MSQTPALSFLLFFALATGALGSLSKRKTVVKAFNKKETPFYFNTNASESQNMSRVLFTGEPTNILYRSYEEDPLFGVTGQCPYLMPEPTQVPSGSFRIVLGYRKDGERVNVTKHAELRTYDGYPAPNILSIKPAKANSKESRLYTLIFSDYYNCSVVKSSYMSGCEIWAPTSTAGQEPTPCCLFLYEILCGKMKYNMYNPDLCSNFNSDCGTRTCRVVTKQDK